MSKTTDGLRTFFMGVCCGWLSLALLLLLTGNTVGAVESAKELEAVKAGAARWVRNSDTGEAKFEWIDSRD